MSDTKIWEMTIKLSLGVPGHPRRLLRAILLWRYRHFQAPDRSFRQMSAGTIYRDHFPSGGYLTFILDGATLVIQAYEYAGVSWLLNGAGDWLRRSISIFIPDRRPNLFDYGRRLGVHLERELGVSAARGRISKSARAATQERSEAVSGDEAEEENFTDESATILADLDLNFDGPPEAKSVGELAELDDLVEKHWRELEEAMQAADSERQGLTEDVDKLMDADNRLIEDVYKLIDVANRLIEEREDRLPPSLSGRDKRRYEICIEAIRAKENGMTFEEFIALHSWEDDYPQATKTLRDWMKKFDLTWKQ